MAVVESFWKTATHGRSFLALKRYESTMCSLAGRPVPRQMPPVLIPCLGRQDAAVGEHKLPRPVIGIRQHEAVQVAGQGSRDLSYCIHSTAGRWHSSLGNACFISNNRSTEALPPWARCLDRDMTTDAAAHWKVGALPLPQTSPRSRFLTKSASSACHCVICSSRSGLSHSSAAVGAAG